ncbi:MAG TPA: ECF-type sigma factor [Bryobacteraceae bacterium]|jgi:RNA polymerase sigma factor (TIGR02999 family)
MQLTVFLQRLGVGDRKAMHDVIPLVYDELKKLARSHLRREMGVVSIQTTALVHEAFLKLSASKHPAYENRAHFFGIASRLMRQVLVDAARARTAEKRLAAQEISLADLPDMGPQPNRTLLEIDDALNRLEEVDPLKARLIEMRYFGGMTAEESASAVSKPVHVVRRELRLAQAWLRRELSKRPQVLVAVSA